MAEHANADARPNPKAPTKATLVDAGLHLMLEKAHSTEFSGNALNPS